ncbi:MAG: hypothetical protein HOO96_06030 [Polyangiaceae bacterium]|nr:hypothetical protein [Polyangiaceae bacterium]
MRPSSGLWVVATCAALASCSTYRVLDDADAGSGTVDAGSSDAPISPGKEAGPPDAGGNDAGDASTSGPPLAQYLVLQLEADAPNGFQASGAFRDLSPKNQPITLTSGTVQLAFSGTEGAKSVTLGAVGFDVQDSVDLRFGAADDFLYVARTSVSPPEDNGGGCAFRYLVSKYDMDGTRSPMLRTCWKVGAHELVGALVIGQDTKVIAPPTLSTGFEVVSFGRYLSGTHTETFAAGQIADAVTALVDVSAPGTPLSVGVARVGGPAGSLIGYWPGRLNRFYVYHAPAGTLGPADFARARDYVRGAHPIP